MPDVDTDGGLWYQWYLIYINKHKLLYEVTPLAGYPFGYDISASPINNLIYNINIFILEKLLPYSWSNLILVTNISSLITYPLSALSAYFLSIYLTRNRLGSFIAGLIFSFSFYHVYMGRGQMSINHIEFIPLYFLSLFYFLDKKTNISLVVSSVIFGLMFSADAYYAFFSGIFSIILFFFYGDIKIKQRIVLFLRYYSVLFLVFILLNFNFVLSNFYLFDKVKAAATGRNSMPRNELTNVLYYFSPLSVNFLYKYGVIGNLMYILPLLISMFGIFILKRNKNYLIFLVCFLLGIVLSSYIPALYWINVLYFKYFGMFRGVGRVTLLAYLFLGLTVGMIISELRKNTTFRKYPTLYFFLIAFLSISILLSSLNRDDTWYRNTDFSKLARLYEPLKNNSAVKSVAVYPVNLNFVTEGFPQPYQLLGQLIHNKNLANGASLGVPESVRYQERIRDISNIKTVDYLTKYNIDAILIYNKIIKDSDRVNAMLKNDERLEFMGRYKESYDAGYVSSNDLSRDISIYQIKKREKRINALKTFSLAGASKGQVSYKQESAYSYVLNLKNVKDLSRIEFEYPYSKNWALYNKSTSFIEGMLLRFGLVKEISLSSRYNEYKNSWIVDSRKIKYKTINPDNTINTDLTVYFKPNSVVYLGSVISNVTLGIVSLYLVASITTRYLLQRKVKN